MGTDSSRRIDEAAGDWLARRDSGAWSPDDAVALEAWMKESTRHRVAFLRVESAWEDVRRLKALGAGVRSDRPPPPGNWNLSPFFRPFTSSDGRPLRPPSRVQAVAASLALAIVIGVVWYGSASVKSYETPVGGVASVQMSDGSKVTLNTDSKIKVAMTAKERRIELSQGEAFFEVAKDARRPFVVEVGGKRIVVLGTKFSVRREVADGRDDVRIVVTEGIVSVESAGGAGAQSMASRLAAGYVAQANQAGLLVQRKPIPEAEEQLSWRSGVLVFRDVTLMEAAAEFNRYNKRKIVIEDPGAAALRIAGNFRATNVDAFVRLLERGYPVRTGIESDEIVIGDR